MAACAWTEVTLHKVCNNMDKVKKTKTNKCDNTNLKIAELQTCFRKVYICSSISVSMAANVCFATKSLLLQLHWKNGREFCRHQSPLAASFLHPQACLAYPPPHYLFIFACPFSMHSHFTITVKEQPLDTPIPPTYSSPAPHTLCYAVTGVYIFSSFFPQNFTLHYDNVCGGLLV